MARLFDDGSNEYLTGSYSLTGEPFTLAAWVYTDDNAINEVPLSVGDNASGDYCAIQIRGADAGDFVWAVTFQGGARDQAITSAGISTNTWHHLCGIFAASNDRRVYLDGSNKGTDASARAAGTINRVTVAVSADNTPFGYFSGRICECAIWDVALTDAEVAILGADGFSPLFVRPQNLVSFWSLIRTEDQDRVGGYDLAPQNTPSVAAHAPVMYPASPSVPFGVAAAPPAPGTIAASIRWRIAYKSQDD